MSSNKGESVVKGHSNKHICLKLRFLASVSILAFIMLIGLWVPFALAADGDSSASSGVLTKDQTDPSSDSSASSVTTDQITAQPDDSTGASVSLAQDQVLEDPAGSNVADTDAESGQASTASDAPADKASGDSSTETPPGEGGVQDSGDSSAATAAPATAQTTSSAPTEANEESAGGDQYGGCEDCEDTSFDLDLICGEPFWESREDYDNRLLSITYEIHNNGPGTAYNVRLTSATATNGVTAKYYLDLTNWEEIAADSSVYLTIKWLVPDDVTHFVTTLEICAGCKDGDDDGDGNDDGDDENAGGDQYGEENNNNDNHNNDKEDDGGGGGSSLSGGTGGDGTATNSTAIVTPPDPASNGSSMATGIAAAATPAGSLPMTGFTLLAEFMLLASGLFVAAFLLLRSPVRTARKRR